ncbi:hypothetical protein [Ruegeria marisrubri]|uniref:hypothetical protein n=1 Tax=Ruegeria marisrubri TaxID=1685379 RepID=UPI0012FD7B0A|nr:hypothetical protein [Ruegeria marisrubri]
MAKADIAQRSHDFVSVNVCFCRKAVIFKFRSKFRCAGQTCLMPPQQDFATDGDHISVPVAAARHNFPEAVIERRQNSPNWNRSFAAPASDVSHAGLNCHSHAIVDGTVGAVRVCWRALKNTGIKPQTVGRQIAEILRRPKFGFNPQMQRSEALRVSLSSHIFNFATK